MRRTFQFTAAAAVLVLAVCWAVVGSSASTALAEVIEAARNHRVVRYKLETSAEIKMRVAADRGEEFVPTRSEDVVYFDLDSPRFRIERHEKTLNGTVQSDWVTIQDNQQDKVLVQSSIALIVTEDETDDEDQLKMIRMFKQGDHAGNKARLFHINDEGVRSFTDRKTDQTFLEILQGFQNQDGVIASKASLDGRATNKYELTEKDMTATLWVDSQTMLPVRIEQQLRSPKPNIRQWKWVYTDFEWDMDVGSLDTFFSTEPPNGYSLEDHTKDE